MEFTLKGYVFCCIYASVHFKTEVCVVFEGSEVTHAICSARVPSTRARSYLVM